MMERPFAIDHLDHVVLRVRDLEASLAFYELIGGQREAKPRPAGIGVHLAPGQTLILQQRTDYEPAPVGMLDHLAFAIQADDIHQVAAYLREHGAAIEREDASPTLSVLNTRDPDGTLIEIRINH